MLFGGRHALQTVTRVNTDILGLDTEIELVKPRKVADLVVSTGDSATRLNILHEG